MQVLRQGTAVDVLLGPFLNDIDGNTKQTGLTIAAADVLLSKAGQALTLKTDVTACAHDADANYNCELDATDTGTVGTLSVRCHVAGALAVRQEFQVVEQAVFDDFYAGSAVGYPTAAEITADMDSNSAQLAAIVADTNELQGADIPGTLATIAAYLDTEIAAILLDTGTTLPGLIAAIQADTDNIQSRLPAALVGGLMSVDVTAISTSTAAADALEVTTASMVQGIATGTPTTSTMAASALTEATDDHYVGRSIIWTSGVAKDIAVGIIDYNGTTKTFTFTTAVTACAADDTFIII